jgi:hypothetical protein
MQEKSQQTATANCQLPTANCQLPTADCQLPTANCQLPTLFINNINNSLDFSLRLHNFALSKRNVIPKP